MSEFVESRPTGIHALGNAYLSRRYAILFYTLLLTVVAVPLAAALELTGALIEIFLAARLLAAVIPVNTAKGRRWIRDIIESAKSIPARRTP
jgi:hypothetical protein